MAINININLDKTAVLKIEKAVLRRADATLEAVATDVQESQVVPFDTGALSESGYVHEPAHYAENGQIEGRLDYQQPYARRLYFNEENFHIYQTKNINAKDHWLEDYTEDGEKTDWVTDTLKDKLTEALK